jgi:DNA polymerase III delta prime subunit
MLSKTLAILVAGKAGVGKTTSADCIKEYLVDRYGLSGIISPIAAGVKLVARRGFGWDGNKDIKGRLLLQEVGKAGRNYNQDLWIKSSLSYFYSSSPIIRDFVIFDDWRFPNELDYLSRDAGLSVLAIRIESPEREILRGLPAYDDVSETSLPSVEFSDKRLSYKFWLMKQPSFYKIVVNNNSSLKSLRSVLDGIMDGEISNLDLKSRMKGE